ncbi:hypothetical protein D3C72_2531010 [compost metagenome]
MMVFCLSAAMVPKMAPSITASTKAAEPILAETGSAWLTRSLTLKSLYLKEGPRSPCSRLPR